MMGEPETLKTGTTETTPIAASEHTSIILGACVLAGQLSVPGPVMIHSGPWRLDQGMLEGSDEDGVAA